MGSITRYLAINTKISALYGKLLKEEDYKKIISLKNPSEIAAYLKNNTAYGEFFRDKDPAAMHRTEIEQILKSGLINYMDKVIHYFSGEYRNFIKCFYMKYEITDLKRAARLIHIDKDFKALKDNLIFAGKYKYIDMDKVIKARSISELIEALRDTIYYPFIKNLKDEETGKSLYRFEMSIDKAYFYILENSTKYLSREDRDVFYSIVGSVIDMLNLRWIYRGKKYYKITPEELFNYTVTRGYRFNYRKIKEFCYCSSINEFLEMVKETPYGFMFKGCPSDDIFIERRTNRYIYFKMKRTKQRYNPDLSVLLAYLELIEFEIRDIISMIENVRYDTDYVEAAKYLIKAI